MQYALFPFASLRDAGGPDIRAQLQVRSEAAANTKAGRVPPRGIRNLDLLDEVVMLLRGLPWQIQVDHCHEENGDLQLAVVAMEMGRNLEKEDKIGAGFFLANSETGRHDTVACERVFRVACSNGYLLECEQYQSMVIPSPIGPATKWREKLAEVVARSFEADGFDRDLARFRATTTHMLLTPYELLCNLVAQRIISEGEQIEIQHEFDAAGDATLYGLINAVTRIAHRLRDFDEWRRAFEIERLGGEILRGDHQPPILDPVYR